jgi:hypothetical protein
MSDSSQENLLSRWSRRKLQSVDEAITADEAGALEQKPLPEQELPSDNLVSEEVIQQPILTDVDMPAIESLDETSDFSMFMSSGVSDQLRNMALRKMFKAPVYNIRDGLDDYDELYTSFEKLGDIVTSDMKHQIAMKAKKKMEEEAQKALDVENNNTPENPQTIEPEQDSESISKAPQESLELESKDSIDNPDAQPAETSLTAKNTETS